MQSQDERDVEGFAARKERDGSVKESAGEEITGKYEGEELDERRAARPPDDRFRHLETKHDELKRDVEKKHDELKSDVREVRSDVKNLSGEVSKMGSAVSGAVGKIDGQEGVLIELLSVVKKSAERDHVTFNAKVEVEKQQELAKVEVEKQHELAEIEVTKEEKVDTVKARADRRKRNLKILSLLASGGAIVELAHQLWEKLK
jgi:predicted  nucleic acid-binding Zn-ribbon protein